MSIAQFQRENEGHNVHHKSSVVADEHQKLHAALFDELRKTAGLAAAIASIGN
jgi:hypothetical protein